MIEATRTRISRRRGALAAFAVAPLIALAVAAAPCDCPGHGTAAASPGGHAHHAGAGEAHAMRWVILDDGTPAPEQVGARQELSVAEATAKLSRRCRKLVKAKRPSRLSAADRRRRTACLKQRRALIAASRTAPAATTPSATTPAATTPPTPTPVATPLIPGATPAPTPTPDASSPCAGKNPCFAAAGVTARDVNGVFVFTLTRGTVMADRVSFEFANADAQDHNLWIKPKGSPDSASTLIAGDLAPNGRVVKELALTPGTYVLRCRIAGHESMTVDFVVQAPIR